MFTIYGRANSSNVRKVLWLCAEIGQTDYERLDYGRGYTPCSSPEYVALNPNQLVPTLVDGDQVIWESNTILRHLATKYGPQAIYPETVPERTRVEMWMDWQLTTALPGVRDLFMGLHVKEPAFTDPEVLEAAQAQARQAFGILDAHLEKAGRYVAGDDLTIADCALGIFVHRWFVLPFERPAYPALAAYYERLQERRPFQDWIIGIGV